MKVMMIDPWGINNISLYTNGLCKGISDYVDLVLCTNYYYEKTTDADYVVKPIFFKRSEKMKRTRLRKIIRGVEYIKAYQKILKELKKNKYDVVHIQWLLQYKVDIYFLKEIKKYCKKIVYTAHNVVPHVHGEKYINDLKEIYDLVDCIILHGEGIKNEFLELFEEFGSKIVIQRHGTYLNQNTTYDVSSIESHIVGKVEQYNYNKVFIFFGGIFYNKGVDRLVKMWIKDFKDKEQLLIIAGRQIGEYKELDKLQEKISRCNNILYINRYVEDNLLNYLINKSDIILLPYRHASMSGVVFTAAEFKKPVLSTDTGSISEYIMNGENSFIIENRDDAFYKQLKYISNEISKNDLADMGIKLYKHIVKNYSWDSISKKLVEDVYFL